MIVRIDTLLSDHWKQAAIEPAPPADEFEFLRRICLDLTGTIPTVHQIYAFTEDETQPVLRRAKLVEKLLDSPGCATHLATTWRMRMLPDDFDPQQLDLAEGLQSWLWKRFANNRRFDDLVADFLVATGTGDRGPGLPPSHPELLDELSAYFVATEFDLKELLRTLALTNAYALSSKTNETNRDHPEAFACMATKVLTPEQLYDSLSIAIGSTVNRQFPLDFDQPDFFRQRRRDFLTRMRTNASRPTEYEAGLPQALLLMNGSEISVATDGKASRLIASLDAPFFLEEQKLKTLFLATVSRSPTAAEKDRLGPYLETFQSESDRQQALSDILWALLNSAEFTLNH